MTGSVPEDDLTLNFPAKPSELRALTNEQLATLYRKLAYANKYPFDTMVERELAVRLVDALVAFKKSSDRTARWVIGLTVVLVAMTAVLIWLTTRL